MRSTGGRRRPPLNCSPVPHSMSNMAVRKFSRYGGKGFREIPSSCKQIGGNDKNFLDIFSVFISISEFKNWTMDSSRNLELYLSSKSAELSQHHMMATAALVTVPHRMSPSGIWILNVKKLTNQISLLMPWDGM